MSSSSSSSSSKAKWPFDVFLSFRGEDVRHDFLANLHKCLLHGGINAYIDSEDLRRGDEISPSLMKAIEESRIAVLVFSEDYASSRWCLDELVKVMECRRLKGQRVLPVFYKVKPGDIRGLRESYGDALASHEEKLGKDSERVKKWRQALIEAADLSGWPYGDGQSQDETEFIEKIVKEISNIVARAPLSVAKYPVGVGCRVEKVMSLLNMGSDDTRIIGIWGTGGVGKTTIANDVYNRIYSQFDGCSFLANVRETSGRPDSLVHLQEKLLREILWKESITVLNVNGGANQIRDRLCCRKILLVLDDVDHENQLNALAGECAWFGKGSRIIITTRDKQVLTSCPKDWIYEVEPLDRGEAFKLLSSFAFSGNQTKDISTDLIHNILDYANGLPLAIVVLGGLLCGRSRGEWESKLEELAESPLKDINKVLKISFDVLDDNQKDIFLDIACFFKGRERGYVTRVLDSYGPHPLFGIQTLIERSLVTIGDGGIVQMHDLIQLMGKDIVKHECLDDPGKQSRLWCYDDVYEVLSAAMGTNAIKGIVLQLPSQGELHISRGAFTCMRRLKLLILSNARISGGPVCLPDDLSAGRKKLVCFDGSGSQIKKFRGYLKDFEKLKFINLDGCQSLDYMPNVSCIPNLEELNLHGCKNLDRVHDSVANHRKLWKLNLEYCSKLQRFPDIPNKNESLREVRLGMTSIEELPASIGNLVSLNFISLLCCKKLAVLPSSIYRLQKLRILQLFGCSRLIKFPKEEEDLSEPHTETGFLMLAFLNLHECNLSEAEFLENLSCPHLSRLFLSGNNFTNLPTLERLNDLEELEVSNCQQLQEIPKIPGKLRRLEANNCKSLTRIPSNIRDVEDVELYSSWELVRNGFPVNDLFMPEKFHCQPNCRVVLPGGEMPKWLLPNKEGYISFMASKDLYEKILGVAICVVFQVEAKLYEPDDSCNFELIGFVNCKGKRHNRNFKLFDLDNVWLEYLESKDLWTVDHFGPNDLTHFHISIRVCNYNCGAFDKDLLVKKCGFRLICKPLENDSEVLLQDDQLLDPALFYEVLHADNPISWSSQGLTMVDFSIEHRYSEKWSTYRNISPGREMPKGFFLVEDGTISFKASQDLYNKFVGLYLCVVFDVEDGEKEVSFDIIPSVNGQRRNEKSGTLSSFDIDHMWFQFFKPNVLWGFLEGAVDFGQFDKSYLIFSLDIRVAGATVKRLGYMMQSDPLEDALKVKLEKNRLMDPASLLEDEHSPWYYGSSGWKDLCETLEYKHGGRDSTY
ncbi:hypothetical protein ACJRO7_031016 [Eucalyptus globulus]|uniref:TIR domain-containing protein n=1 Tax=Eucalyptus globulus TaxID=34317 RepID=A0ABD3JRA9_EUCGL